MTVPFRVEPDSPKRPAQADPFLEFESERPSFSSLLKPQDELRAPIIPPPPAPLPGERRESAINPTIAFALGVAGLVTAAVGYYQMSQVLAGRSPTPAVSGATGARLASTAAVKPVGRLEVTSDPLGAGVTVDGVAWGVTPLTLREISSGRHTVIITRGASSVTREVDVAIGSTSVVTAVIGPAGARAAAAPADPGVANRVSSSGSAGWISFETPFEMRILDRGRPRGTSRGGRLSLAEGSHELEFVNDLYEVRHRVLATVVAGRSTRVNVPIPNGSLSINALPWADVWIDGTPVGTTPLANLSLPVGPHEVTLKHPTLGERRHAVVVKAVTPGRLGISLR